MEDMKTRTIKNAGIDKTSKRLRALRLHNHDPGLMAEWLEAVGANHSRMVLRLLTFFLG